MSTADREKWNQRYREGAYSDRTHASPILADWIELVPFGKALDVACGAGRNALFLAAQGFDVDAVDISQEALERAGLSAQQLGLRVNWIEYDLDDPLTLDSVYQLILVIRYVNLPLIQELTANLVPGGFLICEQHLVTDKDVIGPTNANYRVKPGELRLLSEGLRVHHLEEGMVIDPDGQTAALARLVAQRI